MNSAYNQKPLEEQSRRLTQFVIGNQQYKFNRLFYGISIGPAAFSAFMCKLERNTITPLKYRMNATQKLQPPSCKRKIQEFFGKLNFLSKYIYKMQLYLRPFYNILRQQNNFEWTTEHQKRFEQKETSH